MNVKETGARAYAAAKAQGRFSGETSFDGYISMIHSELSEALGLYREGETPAGPVRMDSEGKPQGIAVELADVAIRTMTLATHEGIPLQAGMASLGCDPVNHKEWQKRCWDWSQQTLGPRGNLRFEEELAHGHRLAADINRDRAIVQMAKLMIWVASTAHQYGLDLGHAIDAKIAYNETLRPTQRVI